MLQDKPVLVGDCYLTYLASFRPDAIRADAELKSGLLDVTYCAIAESTSRPIERHTCRYRFLLNTTNPDRDKTTEYLPRKMASNWQDRAAEKRTRIQASIPKEWLVQCPASETSAVELITSSDLLTPKEVEITRSAATDLVKKMSTGDLTSVEVTLAFCNRAALVHQAVSKPALPSSKIKLTLLVRFRQTASMSSSQKLLWRKRKSWMPTLPRRRKRSDRSMDCRSH